MRLKNRTCTIDSARLGKNVKLGEFVTLGYGSSVLANEIGDYTYINKYCLIDRNVVSIGKFCSIAYNARIGLGGHPTDWVSTHSFAYDKKYGFVQSNRKWDTQPNETKIGNDVWIGANATILAGVSIGDGAIVGAHSLVNKDVAPYSIVIGSPARHLRYCHDDETVKKLLKVKWWDLPKEELKKHIEHMENAEDFLNNLK